MIETQSERRSRERTPMRVPVAVHTKDGSLRGDGYTKNLSEGGMFLYSKTKIAPGNDLEIVMILPAEFTQGENRWVCCQASVIRLEAGPESEDFGIAAKIHGMQILPEIGG
jgi:hypothetical protein